MATIKIQSGCVQLEGNDYIYRYTDKEGEHTVVFTASQVPKVGDSITDGVLVPLVGYDINQDHSKWIKNPPDTWPENKF